MRWLLGAFALAVGSPAILAVTHPSSRFYLLQPMIFVVQAIPYAVAAALWLPWRAPEATRLVHFLVRLLFVGAVLLYVPQITGLWPTGGDMIGLGYILMSIGTTLFVLVTTALALVMYWLRRRQLRVASRRV